uniref:Late transcription factor 3-like protein n=1 Tax=Pithovirus LCPAC403 TaxID=2506596 RepID=A0A481ZB60_9VIRU|nr:MAG: late transcription factor 3-like protein [Pithovirus LCPAC403]
MDEEKVNKLRKFNFRKVKRTRAPSDRLIILGRNYDANKTIYVKIKSDFNILRIHEQIIKKLSIDRNTKFLFSQIHGYERRLNPSMKIVDRKFIESKIRDLYETVRSFEEKNTLHEYIFKTKPFIDAYRDMGSLPVVFSSDKDIIENEQPIKENRLRIILSYLNIAKNYHRIEISYNWGDKPRCSTCGSTSIEEDSNGNIICYTCYSEDVVVVNLPMYRGSINVGRGGKNDYDDRENFKKALKKFQGKQIPKFDKDSLMYKLDEYFGQRNLPLSEDVKTMPLDSRGRRGNTTKGMIQNALKKIGEPDYYSEINLICYLYWGWDILDISHIFEKMLSDYDIFNGIYVTIRDKGKSSALNTEITLYCLLRHNDIECNRKDFKIVRTESIYRGYVQKIEKIFEIADAKYGDWEFYHSWW